MAFPICECGSVPVARRLLRRGLAPGAAVTFMLAAPILNPIVIASTIVAYHGRPDFWVVVLGRFTLGFMVAVAVGWVIGARRPEDVLRKGTTDLDADDHPPEESRWSGFAGHIAGDFIFMGRFLVVGVAVAAAIQTALWASAWPNWLPSCGAEPQPRRQPAAWPGSGAQKKINPNRPKMRRSGGGDFLQCSHVCPPASAHRIFRR